MAPVDRPREAALAILRGAEEGSFADVLLERTRPDFSPLDNAFILELVYGVLRNRERLDWALDRLSERPVGRTDSWTRNLLRLGAYQLLFLDRVPASAAVNTSAELAKKRGKKPGYVNGLLRNLDRNRSAIAWPGPDDPVRRLSVLYSHPAWLVERWLRCYGPERTEAVLASNNRPAPLVIRTNTLRTSRDRLAAALASQGAQTRGTACSPAGLEIVSGPGLTALSAFQDGWFMVQDEAAQLVSLLLAPRPGSRVLDACAAPGGKTTHLAELMQDQGTIVALESDQLRLDRVRENCSRLGITCVEPVTGDAGTYDDGAFDHILVDAPCSGLGTLRRRPDGRWTKQERDIRRNQASQSAILANCARMLKPGGSLVYATCTTEPEENEQAIADFLKRNPSFSIDDPRPLLPAPAAALIGDDRFFRTFPDAPDMDGFFGVRLLKK